MKKILLTMAIIAAALCIETSAFSAEAPGNVFTDNTIFEVVIFKDEIKIGEALVEIKDGEAYKIDFQNKVAFVGTSASTTHPNQTVEERIDYVREGVFLAILAKHATTQGVSMKVFATSSHIIKMHAACDVEGRHCVEAPDVLTRIKKMESEIAYGEPLTILLEEGYEINLTAQKINEVEKI